MIKMNRTIYIVELALGLSPRKVEIGNNLSDYNPQLLQEQQPMSQAQAENLRSTWQDNLAS